MGNHVVHKPVPCITIQERICGFYSVIANPCAAPEYIYFFMGSDHRYIELRIANIKLTLNYFLTENCKEEERSL
jgi:hypothetical protein